MKTIEEWAKHYGYDPEDESAKADYLKYQEGLEMANWLFPEPGDGSSKGNPLPKP